MVGPLWSVPVRSPVFAFVKWLNMVSWGYGCTMSALGSRCGCFVIGFYMVNVGGLCGVGWQRVRLSVLRPVKRVRTVRTVPGLLTSVMTCIVLL